MVRLGLRMSLGFSTVVDSDAILTNCEAEQVAEPGPRLGHDRDDRHRGAVPEGRPEPGCSQGLK